MTPDATPTPYFEFTTFTPAPLMGIEFADAGTLTIQTENKILLQIDDKGHVTISPYITLEDLEKVIKTLREQCGK